MSHLALYRAFRPRTFDELIGQEHVTKTLINQIKTDRVGHAYLFCGARGTGKTSAAKIFAKAINCLTPINGSPCGECEACKKLENPSNLDIVEMDAASNNKVENIRDLRDKVQYPPVAGRYKVYIIDEVHMLTTEAFNALLKTLEEPPAHAVFVLATTEAHKLPATILSRCLRFDFKLISTQEIARQIAAIYDKLGKPYEKEAVTLIAKSGEGSMRDALSVADICFSYGNGKLTYDDVLEVLGTSDRNKIEELAADIINGDTGAVLSAVDDLTKRGKSVGVLNRDICSCIRDLLVVKTCKNANDVLSLPEDKLKELQKIAASTDAERLLRCAELFSEVEGDLKYSTHPKIIFETAALKASMPKNDYSIGALLARVSALETTVATLSEAVKNSALPSAGADSGDVKRMVAKTESSLATEFSQTAIDVGKSLPKSANASFVNGDDKKLAAKQSVSADSVNPTDDGEDYESLCASRPPEFPDDGGFYCEDNSAPISVCAPDPTEENCGFDDGAAIGLPQNSGEVADLKLVDKERDGEKSSVIGRSSDGGFGEKEAEKPARGITPKVDCDKAENAASGASSADDEKLWGLMLRKMRADKEIMMWVACQDLSAKASGGKLVVTAPGDNEYEFISKPENAVKLDKYARMFGAVSVTVVRNGENLTDVNSDVDADCERVKKLFEGENLIIKE